jgi:hypothetical protein
MNASRHVELTPVLHRRSTGSSRDETKPKEMNTADPIPHAMTKLTKVVEKHQTSMLGVQQLVIRIERAQQGQYQQEKFWLSQE